MKTKQSSSINIIRDQGRDMNYLVSANTERLANLIVTEFDSGVHSFNIIGSYGTGKSSFLWAFTKSLYKSDVNFFNFPQSIKREIKTINIVGEYNSLIDYFSKHFSIKNKLKGNQEIFDCLYQEYEPLKKKGGTLIICIDEFGKFLEYAAKNNPEKEMYFVQQLAEFVNDPDRSILLLTSVHQAIDSYSSLLSDNQKNEWKKVKGRLKEIPFNEPIENLLFLASKFFKSNYPEKKKNTDYLNELVSLNIKKHCFSLSQNYLNDISTDLYPLDLFSGIVLTQSLQRYGQNERSLFTFLQSSDHLGLDSLKNSELYDLPKVYDYLFVNLYSTLKDKYNPDYSQWSLIKDKLEIVETKIEEKQNIASDLVKTIGLLSIFCSKGASIDEMLLAKYFSFKHSYREVTKVLRQLENFKIIRFSSYNDSFKLLGGTDVDIEKEILRVSNNIDTKFDIVPKLKEAFSFPIITANEFLFKTGTPRLFQFRITDNLLYETPEDEIDGFINLVFNENLDNDFFIEKTKNQDTPILYAHYLNSFKIREILIEITKTEQVLKDVDEEDKVAKRELKTIIDSQKTLLSHYVLDALYSKRTKWYYNGENVKIPNKKTLNNFLSEICKKVYSSTPNINMELINKHKVSGAINSARKLFFDRLANHWSEKDLGYPSDKFPADKTIYWCLLKNKGIHQSTNGSFILNTPNNKDVAFTEVWNVCESFLMEARTEEKPLVELIDTLKQKPFKLKQGVIDFLVPTFLFTKRGDFALYNTDTGYNPYIDDTILYLITRNPQEYTIKSFELSNLRLNLFNKYRDFLNQNKKEKLSNTSFVESIRPFLILYKNLTPYSQKTKRLSKEALALREAIAKAKDPEKVFFEKFPKALGYDVQTLVNSEKLFDEYILKLQNTVLEVKDSFDELHKRIETYLTKEVLGTKTEFPKYKTILQKRFSSLKEHQILPSQKKFMLRVNSNLDDRDSWLNSIAFALLSKPLKDIVDNEEQVLKERLSFIVKELDNLCDIHKLESEKDEDIYKLDFTSKKGGLKNHLIRVSKTKKEEVIKGVYSIEQTLGKDKQVRIAILTELLKKELNE